MVIGTYISIITLNMNGLNAPTKGHRTQDPGMRNQDPGPRTQDPEHRTQNTEPRTQNTQHRTQNRPPIQPLRHTRLTLDPERDALNCRCEVCSRLITGCCRATGVWAGHAPLDTVISQWVRATSLKTALFSTETSVFQEDSLSSKNICKRLQRAVLISSNDSWCCN